MTWITKEILVVTLLLNFSLSSYLVEKDGYKSYKNYKLFEIKGESVKVIELVKQMKRIDNNLPYIGNSTYVQIIVNPTLLPVFEVITNEQELSYNLLSDDYSQIIELEKEPLRNRIDDTFSWTAYYDVDGIYNYLRNVSKNYSNWTQLIIGGESYEGRQILGLRINVPTQDDAAKLVMFIESGIHAREWITPATTTYFINQLLTSEDPKIIALRDQFDWRIFPTVNPDGYHYSHKTDRMWRKTRSKSKNGCYGADPNRNWDYNWLKHGATSDPCDYQVYGGLHPFSEIETRSLASYIASIDNLVGYIAFHSDAQCLLVPYSDSEEHNDNYDDLIKIGKTSLSYGYNVNKAQYDGPATAAEILYKASGGSMDWVRYNLSTPLVFTYELRGWGFSWPPHLIYQQGDEVTQMMLGLVTEASQMGYF